MSTRTTTLIAVGIALSVLTGCTDAKQAPESTDVGTQVAHWAEPDQRAIALRAAVEPGHPVVLQTAAERDQFVRKAASGAHPLPATSLSSIDMKANVLVLGGYDNCQTGTSLKVAADQQTLEYRTFQNGQVDCAWSPLTVDVWQVPRTALGAGPFTVRGA